MFWYFKQSQHLSFGGLWIHGALRTDAPFKNYRLPNTVYHLPFVASPTQRRVKKKKYVKEKATTKNHNNSTKTNTDVV